jgi:dTDP-4-amino-4,6-dideoxygalactose transaminase
VATAGAAVACGARPVFVEIGSDHLMDPDDVAAHVTSRTKAIVPVQLNGRTLDMDRLCAAAARHGLVIVEDSAQGLGSRFRGRMAGTFGVAGVFSFYPAKVLGALGDGGAIVTNDAAVADVVRQLRDHGRDPHTGEVKRWGRNSRLDNIQAAVLRAKLKLLDEEIATRRRLAHRYHDRLVELRQLVLPPPPDEQMLAAHFDTFQNYEIEAQDRDQLRAFLGQRGIGTLLQWGGKAIHQFSALSVDQQLPRTEAILSRAMMLPMNSSLTDTEVDYVADQISAFYAGR